ncbi:D-alanyl-D-alanine carboxypeptidase DacB precursor [Corynebacterium ciconiae DSM 44920]|uniref:D-alanyl-D-alanine carboxypeptidase/D-alanyl-D-alanine endopeptidase n=1 Tax=Corynebacterium ciconiae TaxID=227319 RepID=UPI0003791E6E|nr:D-alanyl-D-alanine carboxypeptidase/D-alanyl-D-alanine-endopeptidase [Corynebacterium ciconiae]WKD61970.1 D-alanyl-D-alanine carboxypeptidase DacB precursor [Corynebacterium ciconiae DSM 44920]
MSAKAKNPKTWWVTSIVVAGAAVASIAGVGIQAYVTERGLSHPEVVSAHDVTGSFAAAEPQAEVDNGQLGALIADKATDPRLGSFTGVVSDTSTGEQVWSVNPDEQVRPASATKLLTAAAALIALGENDQLTTTVHDDGSGTVVLKAAGDVMLNDAQLDSVVEQLSDTPVEAVAMDTSVWPDEPFSPKWNKDDIAGGYIAPMQPMMLNGARIGAEYGDVPRSTTPAEDVAQALAKKLGVEFVGAAEATGPAVASVSSEPLAVRLHTMMVHSDNVMAEAIGREVAVHTGYPATQEGSREATLAVLAEHGIDTSGMEMVDNSGLSTDNAISAAAFVRVLSTVASDPALRPLLNALPVAGGEGSLSARFGGSSGEGWVRAKTGTLTNTAALAGLIPAENGHTYAFAFICNDASVLPARAAMDELASSIRSF